MINKRVGIKFRGGKKYCFMSKAKVEKVKVNEPKPEVELVEIYDYTGESLMVEFRQNPKFKHEEVIEYLQSKGLIEEMTTILATYTCTPLLENLAKFSMRYGVLSIVRFVYEYVGFPFDISYLGKFGHFDYLDADGVHDHSSEKWVRSKYSKHDAYYMDRLKCLSYFSYMKRYSRLVSFDAKSYYIFNFESMVLWIWSFNIIINQSSVYIFVNIYLLITRMDYLL